MNMSLKEKAKKIRDSVPQLYIALKTKETPWYAKAMGIFTIAYALSPIDFIPDFIPVIGYLDDILLLPLFISITIKMIPKDIWESSREKAMDLWKDGKPKSWGFAVFIIILWMAIIALVLYLIIR
jgi:uncharacterized membrane protein YkvA (DUF1232 family)